MVKLRFILGSNNISIMLVVSILLALLLYLANLIVGPIPAFLFISCLFIITFLFISPQRLFFLTIIFLFIVNPVFTHFVPATLGFIVKEILVIACFLMWLIKTILNKKPVFRSSIELWIIPFIICMFINAVAFNGFLSGLYVLRTVALYAFMYFVSRDFLSSMRKIELFISSLVFIGIANALVEIPQFLFPYRILPMMGFVYGEVAFRSNGLAVMAPGFMSGHATGAILGMVLVMCLSQLQLDFFQLPLRKKFGKLIIIFFLIGGIVLSASRGSLVGLFIGLSYFFLVSSNRARIRTLIFILVAVGVGLLVFRDYLVQLVSSIWGGTTSTVLQNSNLARLEIYREDLRMFINAPIFGQGLSVAGASRSSLFTSYTPMWAHSYFLKILVQTGLVGFSLWAIVVFGWIFWASNMVNRIEDHQLKVYGITMIMGIITLLATNIFNELLEDVAMNVLLWCLFGAVFSVIFLGESKKRNASK